MRVLDSLTAIAAKTTPAAGLLRWVAWAGTGGLPMRALWRPLRAHAHSTISSPFIFLCPKPQTSEH